MKKFILKLSLFVFILGIMGIGLLYSNSSAYLKKFKNIDHTYDIVNFGNSHGNGFKYDELGINGKSFNRDGNTLYYDLQNYKYVKPYLNKGAIVIIPISYFSFGLDENRTDKGDINPFVNDFYFYLPIKSIYSYTVKRNAEVYLNTVRVNYYKLIEKSFHTKNTIKPKKDIPKLQSLIQHSIKRSTEQKKLGTFSGYERNMYYLSQLINDVIKNGYQPILVTVPYFGNYNSNFDKEWLNIHYYNHIKRVREEFNIPYFNYSNDNRFDNDISLFTNSDHLNEEGSIYFSKIFFEDLKLKGLLK